MSAMVTKLIVLGGFAVAFTAGLVTGFQQQKLPVSPPTAARPFSPTTNTGPGRMGGPTTRNAMRPPPPASILTRELNLQPEQRAQLQQIWEQVAMMGTREMERRRQELRSERENAIQQLLEAEAAEEYRFIQDNFNQQLAALEAQWWDQYRKGVDQTKAILNPQQLERYEQILNRNTWGPDRGGRGGRGGSQGPWRGQGGSRGDPDNNRRSDEGRNRNGND